MEVNSKDYPEIVIQNLCKEFSPKGLNKLAQKRDMYVATEGDTILGTASLENNTIFTVFVHPKYHGQGIGTKLMDHVEWVARKRGYPCVTLFASITALQFYEKLGYKKIREIHKEATGTCTEMSKAL